jgi:hypothetical protein
VYSITSKSSLNVIENVKKEIEKRGKEVGSIDITSLSCPS